MFKFWGDGSQEAMDLVNAIRVRSTENFNWTFIFKFQLDVYLHPGGRLLRLLDGDPQEELRGRICRACAVRRTLAV